MDTHHNTDPSEEEHLLMGDDPDPKDLTVTVTESEDTNSTLQRPDIKQHEHLTEQSIRRIIEEAIDSRMTKILQPPNKRRLRASDIQEQLKTEAMRALACNNTANAGKSEQQRSTTDEQSSNNPTTASRRGSSDSQNSAANTDKMRKRLGEIEDSLPPPLKGREGLKLRDALDWQEDAPLPSLPPAPKFMGSTGSQEFWCSEKAKFISNTYSRELSLSLRKKVLQTISTELEAYISNTQDFLTVLARVALQTEKTVLQEIYSWRNPSRSRELDQIKFITRGFKRNQRINFIQYYLKFRSREFTRAVLTLKDAIQSSTNNGWEENQLDFINGLKCALKRAWWVLNLHKGVSRRTNLKELRF